MLMELNFCLFNSLCVVMLILSSCQAQLEKLSKVLKVEDSYPQQMVDPSSTFEKMSKQWPFGVVQYYIDTDNYDNILQKRILNAMENIESVSCIIFRRLTYIPSDNKTWLHFTNPKAVRTCEHGTMEGNNNNIIVVIGFECTKMENIVHSILHGLGFMDEVTHPLRDQYIRIVWENIQPKYRNLFQIHRENLPYKLVEYDPMSIMHFHDRAYSFNGGPTIAPLIPGMIIKPSDRLSQLDIMKLHMTFYRECNKRKVEDLISQCKETFYEQIHGSEEIDNENTVVPESDDRDAENRENEEGQTENKQPEKVQPENEQSENGLPEKQPEKEQSENSKTENFRTENGPNEVNGKQGVRFCRYCNK